MPVSKFGLSLKILNDTYCEMPNKYKNPRSRKKLYHLATLQGGTKEYVAYLDPARNKVWIEEVAVEHGDIVLKQIDDDNEWHDISQFLWDAKILEVGSRREIPVSEKVALEMGLTNKAQRREI